MSYASVEQVMGDVSRGLRPPVRISVSDAAVQSVRVRTQSGGAAPWSGDLTPYMREPMDMLTSRRHEAVVFVGPAQSGKTQALVDGWVGYMVTCDPSDMMVLQTSQETARDYSKRRIDRLHRQSPRIKERLSKSRQHDNTYDKLYQTGNILSIGWPSINQLSGKAIKFIALTDYDRMPEDIDKEGSPFALAQKRTQTFLSRGMTLVESSPGFDVDDPKWLPSSPHQAPPARGIMSLFNLGDRRRWYWPCQHCGVWFLQPSGIDGFSFAAETDLLGHTVPDVHGVVGVACPGCGAVNGQKEKEAMNRDGLWVPEGCGVDGGVVTGTPPASTIASFWLPGAAAAFQSWESIVRKYQRAMQAYDSTGSEEMLKTVVNVDLGAAYVPRSLCSARSVSDLEARAEDVGKRTVPAGVRFLIAAVDVQGGKFVVQVMGFGVRGEWWLVDRYDIAWSKRLYRDEAAPVDPAGHIEDWELVTEQVVQSSYPLGDASGRRMGVLATGCDSGGKSGVTTRAYTYWRGLRDRRLADRFMLVKGERPGPQSRRRRVTITYPDSSARSDRLANARGEIPVCLIDTTAIKDAVDADLKRAEKGPGYLHLPDWLGRWFYDELAAEVRGQNGWNPIKAGSRNEAFDLLVYAKAVALVQGIEDLDWDDPPAWAAPWDGSSEVFSGERSLLEGQEEVGVGDESDWPDAVLPDNPWVS